MSNHKFGSQHFRKAHKRSGLAKNDARNRFNCFGLFVKLIYCKIFGADRIAAVVVLAILFAAVKTYIECLIYLSGSNKLH